MSTHLRAESSSVAIVGGGLAGLAAAVSLRQAGLKVLLLEARDRLGGRATSYVDQTTGQTIDNCQHVSMGCCTNLHHFCRSLKISDPFHTVETLTFLDRSGRATSFRADPLPAPLHLLRSFCRLPYLSWREILLFSGAVKALARASDETVRGTSFAHWLHEQGQTENLIRNVWEVVLVSALSEDLVRIDTAYARQVFVDGFLSHRLGWTVEIPRRSLHELFSIHAAETLQDLGIDYQLRDRVESLITDSAGTVEAIQVNGDTRTVQQVVIATPHYHAATLLEGVSGMQSTCDMINQLESAPIASVHFWFDRPIMKLPHAVLIGRLSQWVFGRGRSDEGESVYQVVISASRGLGTSQEIIDAVHQELQEAFPAAAGAILKHARVIMEKRAVFSARPGVDAIRPAQETPVSNLYLAGDWTQTGWPATMEGAVRSGYLAAEAILRRLGAPQRLVQPKLPRSIWAKWLLGLRD